MAATAVEGGALVLYSNGTQPGSMVHRALLERDANGVLRKTRHAYVCTVAEFMERNELT